MKKKEDFSGAVVLGLNDALVELSGALVGLSFALNQSNIIGVVGLITGFAASLSMAASEYLSAKEERKKRAFKAATYTGVSYLLAVILLVAPYFIFSNVYHAMLVMSLAVVGIIASFTKYDSLVHKESFKSKFFTMLAITLSVSIISFLFGMLVKKLV